MGSALAAHPDGARGVLINGGSDVGAAQGDWYCRCLTSFLLEHKVCPDRCSHVSYQLITLIMNSYLCRGVEDCAMHFHNVSPCPTLVFHLRGFGLVLSCGDDGVIKANG